jgi:hypothetical protein
MSSVQRVPRLDLERRRDLGELLSTTFELAQRHFAVFLSVSLLLVAPIVIVIDGIWGRALADGADAEAPQAATATMNALSVFIVPAIITALHVALVQGLARGEEPTVGGALEGLRGRVAPALGAVALYTLGVLVGLVLFILPGIWLAVRWYFAPQAAIVDGESPVGALRRSSELVQGQWWRTAGLLLLAGILFGLVTLLLAIPAALAGGTGWLYVTIVVLAQAVGLSLSALFGTLLFFSRRSEREMPWQGLPPVDTIAPERPGSPT